MGVLLLASGALAAPGPDELLLAEIAVNGAEPQTAFVLRDAEGGYWFETSVADALGIDGERPAPREHGGMSFLPVAGFEGGSSRFDPATVSLSVTLPPRYLPDQVRSLRQRRDAPPGTAAGAFLDYDLFYESGAERQRELFSTLLEPTVFGPAGVLRNALLYRSSRYEGEPDELPGFDEDGVEAGDGWIRLETAWVRDDPERLRSLRLGDAILAPGMLGNAARFGGIQVATNFGTRPSLVTFPLPELAGEALLESTVDLYVNGQRLTSETVAPGPFRFEDIPVSTGAGEVSLVTRDLTGREQVVVADFYASQRVLRQGLSEYAYSLGALRRDYGVDSNDYGDVVASGLHRYGVSNHLTVEGQGQVSPDVARTAAGLTVTRPRFGVSSLGLGLSRADGAGTGFDMLLAHEYRTRRLRASGSLRYSSAGHRFVTDTGEFARPRLQLAVGGGYSFDHVGTLSVTFARRSYHDASSIHFGSASLARSFRGGLSVVAYLSAYDGADSDLTAGVSVTRFFGERRSAGLDVVRRDDGLRMMAESRTAVPRGPGLGYRFAGGRDDGEPLWSAGATLHTRAGRYAVGADHDAEGTDWRASAAGSAVWVGGRPFVTREVRDAFAVVRVDSFEGVNVYLDNQPMGRTDATGRILLPGLRPFEANRVRIEVEDLPLNARIDSLETVVAPYAGAGVLADFPAGEGHDAMLRLLLPDGAPAPQGAGVYVDGDDSRFPVGLDGAVYLRGIAEGDRAVLHWSGGRCDFRVSLAGHPGPVPELGDTPCRPLEGS